MFTPEIFNVSTTDGRNFTLLEDVNYTDSKNLTYILPSGSSSDGASTPQAVWNIIPPFGTYWRAAFLHDCAYRNTLLKSDRTLANLTKSDCDELLKDAMKQTGVNEKEIIAIYEGVVLGGNSSFTEDRKAIKTP